MANEEVLYDVAIVGGGLAGLALAIRLRQQGHQILLLEKESYPYHKVCGEYISLESWDYLQQLGVDLNSMNLPIITQLLVSSATGKLLKQNLPLGGFGISRYLLDETLYNLAVAAGVTVLQQTRANDIVFGNDNFSIDCGRQQFKARVACAGYGKRSNIDIKWKRPFSLAPKNKVNNYIGVKYHVKTNFAADTIALHNFKNGYCGLVKIEGDLFNLCYLTRADNLVAAKGDIGAMEKMVLAKNPHLKKILEQSEIVFDAPLTISQVSFDKKSQVEQHVLMVGDAAGMITPLCGNGMSMALHSSKIAAACIHNFLSGKANRDEMEKQYTAEWNKQFARRLAMGRAIQRLLASSRLSEFFIALIKPFPWLVNFLVKQTHGRPF